MYYTDDDDDDADDDDDTDDELSVYFSKFLSFFLLAKFGPTIWNSPNRL